MPNQVKEARQRILDMLEQKRVKRQNLPLVDKILAENKKIIGKVKLPKVPKLPKL